MLIQFMGNLHKATEKVCSCLCVYNATVFHRYVYTLHISCMSLIGFMFALHA
jgi:hypothetical protein